LKLCCNMLSDRRLVTLVSRTARAFWARKIPVHVLEANCASWTIIIMCCPAL
jgi:hypothetical protein